jgi:hypothetical protein
MARTQPRGRRSRVVVPDVVGLNWDNAHDILLGLNLAALGRDLDGMTLAPTGWLDGVVVDQDPAPQARTLAGSCVTLWLERGPGSSGVREPRVPLPGPQAMHGMRDETTGEAVG